MVANTIDAKARIFLKNISRSHPEIGVGRARQLLVAPARKSRSLTRHKEFFVLC